MNIDQEFEKGLPASVDAERSILGAILLDNAAYEECVGAVDSYMFALDSHRRIYKAIVKIITGNRPVDIITLSEMLNQHHEVEAIGGIAYLASLTEGLPRRISISAYIEIVAEKWRAREAISALTNGITRCSDQSEVSFEIIADVSKRLGEITLSGSEELPTAEEQSESAFDMLLKNRKGDAERPIPTGTPSLDKIIGGYRKKKLHVFGGRPSMGKTSKLIQAVIQCMLRHIPAHIAELEMPSEDIYYRLWAPISGVPFEKIVNSQMLNLEDMHAIEQAKTITSQWPLFIEDRPMQTADYIISKARMNIRRNGVGFVGVDYLQKLKFPGKSDQRHLDVGDALVKFGALAKNENIPVLLISSITESGDKNPNKPPTLADLRASGDIQFDTDVAVLIHRNRLEDQSISEDTDLIVAKQRGGRLGTAKAVYSFNSLTFSGE